MANMPFVEKEFSTPKQILMFPDKYQAFPQTFIPGDTTAVTVNGRSIIKAGTIWPANDDTARGVVFYDCDVTDGAAAGAVIFEAAIRVNRVPAAPSDEAKAALPRITWFDDGTWA